MTHLNDMYIPSLLGWCDSNGVQAARLSQTPQPRSTVSDDVPQAGSLTPVTERNPDNKDATFVCMLLRFTLTAMQQETDNADSHTTWIKTTKTPVSKSADNKDTTQLESQQQKHRTVRFSDDENTSHQKQQTQRRPYSKNYRLSEHHTPTAEDNTLKHSKQQTPCMRDHRQRKHHTAKTTDKKDTRQHEQWTTKTQHGKNRRLRRHHTAWRADNGDTGDKHTVGDTDSRDSETHKSTVIDRSDSK